MWALGTQYTDFQGPHPTDFKAGLDLCVVSLLGAPMSLQRDCRVFLNVAWRGKRDSRGLPRYHPSLLLNSAGLSHYPRKTSLLTSALQVDPDIFKCHLPLWTWMDCSVLINRTKGHATDWVKTHNTNHIVDKGLVCKIYEEPSKFNTLKKKKILWKSGQKTWKDRHEKTFCQRTRTAKKHKWIWSASVTIREMHIKTMKYHYIC